MSNPDLPSWCSFDELPHAHGAPIVSGRLRERPEDFQVEEILGFEPTGEGEHQMIQVRKTGANTEWVARKIASHAGLPVSAVGFAGLKDRHAVTTQWFSLHVGFHGNFDRATFEVEGVEVLDVYRHRRKLRRGGLLGNRFLIRVRELNGDLDALRERIARVDRLGVPNYFGAQRFGIREGNLYAAHAVLTGEAKPVQRHLKGLWLSAARSQIFNQVLALRVDRGDWDRPLRGDRMQLDGSRASFLAEVVDDELIDRCLAFDVHPSGPLWGVGEPMTSGEALGLERQVAGVFSAWMQGLATAGLRQERRPLRAHATGMDTRASDEGILEIAFELPAGSYATAVLRELVCAKPTGQPLPRLRRDFSGLRSSR